MRLTGIKTGCLLLIIALFAGMLPLSALAAEEASGEIMSEEAALFSDADMTEEVEEPEEAEETEEPADVTEETEEEISEAAASEVEVSDAEGTETVTVSEAPIEEPEILTEYEFADPDDPLYERYMQETVLQLDGAGTKTWSNFTTRTVAENETLRRGIDVSSWQRDINWTKVKAAGVEFAILRCAYRGVSSGKIVEDGYFKSYIRGAKAAGIRVGVYIFSQAITVEEALEEADYMLNLVRDYDIDLPLVFDLEHYSGGRFSNAKLSKQTVTDMCNAFCERVEAAGYESMVYFNPSNLTQDVYPSQIGRLWLAHYTTKTSYTARGYEYWQCSSDGTVNGISGAVDLDFWFEPDNDNPFSDVSRNAWYYDAVVDAYKGGLVNGMSDTKFEPNGKSTRAQVVMILYRMQGTPTVSTTAGFTDLTRKWYRDAINWAVEENIVKGVSDTRFSPDKAITREDLVTILYRVAGEPATEYDLSGYADAEAVHSWAAQAMAWAVETGVISGYENNTIRPLNKTTRAELCTILLRFSALA